MRFSERHLGSGIEQRNEMVKACGYNSIDELIEATIPKSIRLDNKLSIPPVQSEREYLDHIKNLGKKNKPFRSLIGMGYYGTFIPPVIQRNILENPGWYTAYTPYQAEIAQGRLEALLNFQTMVSDLTGMPLANASLLDEATAAAEAMIMSLNTRSRDQQKGGSIKYFIDENVFPQTIAIIETRAEPLGVECVIGQFKNFEWDDSFFGGLVQYPNGNGEVEDYKTFVDQAHEKNAKISVASDLMALALLIPPGEWGADIVIGNSQRFGVPLGYGGPHAAFFATKEEFKRHIPGRIIGVSKDRYENVAYRMALQTREQHIRRDKATSNICTAQALLAIMAGMYAVYHGPGGVREIAHGIHKYTCFLANKLEEIGVNNVNRVFFDTLKLELSKEDQDRVKESAEKAGYNFRYFEDGCIGVSLDEQTDNSELNAIVQIFSVIHTEKIAAFILNGFESGNSLKGFDRTSDYLTHEVFSAYHTETEMMRYIKRLENKDLSLTHSMIPLGSCTMKLNAAAQLMPITWPEFANIHPYAPVDQCQGYAEMIVNLENYLAEITGLPGVSLQPNSGAQGEYAGLMVIREWHKSRGDDNRDIVLIPSSAHGTNPASAVMAGMKVVVVKCDDDGNIDITDLEEKAVQHRDNLGALMITYPSTHGVFEEEILKINQIVHDNGGQVYMDGANMNAQVGLTSPGKINADVCHLNLHKTFAIPHGGGGPGMGPICAAEHLTPFLPGNAVIQIGEKSAIKGISAAPWGSALILLISYSYIRMLGEPGLKESTELAILNANYLYHQLKKHYDVLYRGTNDTVAHEMIIDCRSYKTSANVEVEDIAKRLMDYGFHAPTVSWPVPGTIMVEPTESESKEELDRFIEALIGIKREIMEIEEGSFSKEDNVLKNAPHSLSIVTSNKWNYGYDREKAAFPVNYLRDRKFWVPVSRIDNAYGDRNLVCTCPSIESYESDAQSALVSEG